MEPQRQGGDPINQDALRRGRLAAKMRGQVSAYAGHQLAFGETTVNDLKFIGA